MKYSNQLHFVILTRFNRIKKLILHKITITIFYQQETSTFCHEKLFEVNGSKNTSKTTTEIKPIDTFTTPNSIDTESPADDNISSDENNDLLEMT